MVRAADLQKLLKLLALLGSEHDGERAAAALAAHRLVQTANTNWAALLAPAPAKAARGAVRTVVAYPFADTVAAAEARLRQMRAENDRLRRDNRRLRDKLAETKATTDDHDTIET